MTEWTRASGPLRGRSFLLASYLSIAVAVYLLVLSVYLSSRRMMWLDEFFAWGVLTDPSSTHAMHAWLEGADSGGVLYYVLGHTLLLLTGPSVLAARLLGAVLLGAAFVLWFRVLRQVFNDRIVLIASSVLLINTGYINYLAEVRFYAQLIACLVLAVWLALWEQRELHSPGLVFSLFFFVHGALVSSHLLGIVYSAMLLVAMLTCSKPKRYVTAATGGVASWSLLIFARQPIHVGGLRVASMHLTLPHWRDLLNVYLLQPSALYKVNLVFYLFLAITFVLWLRRKERSWPLRDDKRSLLFRISLLFGTAPIMFFVESRVAPWSLWVVRYMLPVVLGISGLTAFLLEFQSREPWVRRWSRDTRRGIFAALALTMVSLHISAVRHQVLRPRFAEAQLRPIERGLPVVVADEQLFFQLKFYAPTVAPLYLVSMPMIAGTQWPIDLMTTIARQQYWGGSLRSGDDFLRDADDFLLVDYQQRDAKLINELRRHGWIIQSLGSDDFEGKQTLIFRLTRPKS